MTPDQSPIDAAAAEWAVRLSAGPLPTREQGELDAWLEADVRHRGALVRAQAAWVDLDRVGALAARSHYHVPTPRGASPAWTRRLVLAAGLGAVSMAAATGGWWLWRRRGELYESEVGEIRRVSLADGSMMTLNTATRARVHLSDHQRDVDLLRGEAVFDVAKDPRRPFVVRTRDVIVQAVGTVFVVRSFDQEIDVTVTEGAVDVRDSSGSAPGQRVLASELAIIGRSRAINVSSISPAQVERHLVWQEGMLSFDGESLAEAVSEINRHNTRKIVLDDEKLGHRPVVGLFRASDASGFAETVAAALGARASVESDVIHLQSSGP
jgi:transmembrane sensor